MCNNTTKEERVLERLAQRQKKKVMTMNNPELKLVKVGVEDYRLVLKDEKQKVQFEVKNSAEADHFISQRVYDLNHSTYDTTAGKEVAVGTGLVCLSQRDRYFIEEQKWFMLKEAQVANKALQLISAIDNIYE